MENWKIVTGVVLILFILYIIYGLGQEKDCGCGCGGAKKRLAKLGLAKKRRTRLPTSLDVQPSDSTIPAVPKVPESQFIINPHNDMQALPRHSNYLIDRPKRPTFVEDFAGSPEFRPANSQGF